MLQPAARTQPTPRGTRTRLMASPSGMLWTARARLMNRPRASPPPKDTPIPTPSVKECMAEELARDHDEHQTEEGACQRTQGAVIHALVDQAEAGREHEPGCDGVGDPEPPACGVLRESEGYGAKPGCHRREQREEKDRSGACRF